MVKKIPRANFVPSKRSVVCIKHFREEMVSFEDEFVDSNGQVCKVKRKKPALKKDAYPCIFLGCPSYLTEAAPSSRISREEKCQKKDEEAMQQFLREDTIEDFTDLKSNFINKHKELILQTSIITHSNNNYFYIMFMNFDLHLIVKKKYQN